MKEGLNKNNKKTLIIDKINATNSQLIMNKSLDVFAVNNMENTKKYMFICKNTTQVLSKTYLIFRIVLLQ